MTEKYGQSMFCEDNFQEQSEISFDMDQPDFNEPVKSTFEPQKLKVCSLKNETT